MNETARQTLGKALFSLYLVLVAYGILDIRVAVERQTAATLQNRAVLLERNAQTEKLTLDFMARTVDRWDKLQRDNPGIMVPRVVEPMVVPRLEEMQRQMEAVKP